MFWDLVAVRPPGPNGTPTDWGELVQARDNRDVFQVSPDALPVTDIHGSGQRQPWVAEAPGTANWDAVCVDARKTPTKRVRGVSRNPLRKPGPPLPGLNSRSSAGRPLRQCH